MTNLKNIVKVGLPTKAQTTKAVEIIAVAFVSGFVYSWVHAANPFSKDAVVAAGTAGVAAIYSIVKIFVTNL